MCNQPEAVGSNQNNLTSVVPERLLSLPNVVLTPHLGSGTRQTREAMTRIVVDNVLAFERGDELLTPVG